ncbi:hypothetical protein [Asticcacaulis biprosthecium]|uniref:hypothetical protein n=1 Tax=Asticcacaulis biprosthecium TaxID=76891 RepID=UPI000590EFEC|nr:hypothetical protein [Asticcacaulis biprosthecium]
MSDDTSPEPKGMTGKYPNLAVAGLIILGVFWLTLWIVTNVLDRQNAVLELDQAPVVTAAEPEPVVPAWTAPAMYYPASTLENIPYGFRYLTEGEYQCGVFNRCIGVEFISSQSCSTGFRIEAIQLDGSGANVGTTSSATGLVAANERAKMVLTLNTTAATTLRLARASCF